MCYIKEGRETWKWPAQRFDVVCYHNVPAFKRLGWHHAPPQWRDNWKALVLPLRVNWQALLRCPIEWNLNYSSHMMNWTATCSLPSPFAGTFVLFSFLLRKCLHHMRMPDIACSSDRKVGGIPWLQTDSASVKECIFFLVMLLGCSPQDKGLLFVKAVFEEKCHCGSLQIKSIVNQCFHITTCCMAV